MADTKIDWADKVWNPITGCTKVSAGCKNCYAERIAKRLWASQYEPNADGSPRKFTDVVCHEDRLSIPSTWKKPVRVFVNSMSDLFHEDVPEKFIGEIWSKMLECHHQTFIVLTKRPDRMLDIVVRLSAECQRKGLRNAKNIWLGVSVENQKAADERIPLLLETPAAVRFVSVEPMLEAVDLFKCIEPMGFEWDEVNALDDSEPVEYVEECEAECDWINYGNDLVENPEYRDWQIWRERKAKAISFGHRISWVICGCESGQGARPFDIEWARSLKDQCVNAGVPFFLKQMTIDGKLVKMPELDGKVWAEYPDAKE